MLAARSHAQEPAAEPHKAPLILDLLGGSLLGAELGMDETNTRKALAEHQIADVHKVNYPKSFLLQSRDCPGLTFNFQDNHELTDIYTNSPAILLSNGLKLGQTIKEFTGRLGQPQPARRLPSGVGVELVYRLDGFELGIIALDRAPDIARALTLRKRKQL